MCDKQFQAESRVHLNKSCKLYHDVHFMINQDYIKRSTHVVGALAIVIGTLFPSLHFSLLQQSSNELKGQSTNKTISRNESIRCVNALLIPVSKFHPPAVCGLLMRNKTPCSGEGGWENGSMVWLLRSIPLYTCINTQVIHTNIAPYTHAGSARCYSRTEACFQPCDSVGLIKEHISICSYSASTHSPPIEHTRRSHTHTKSHTLYHSVALYHHTHYP